MRLPEEGFIKWRGHDLRKEMTHGSYEIAGFREGKWYMRIAKNPA